MHLLHSYQKSLILNKHTEKDWHDWLGWSYTQGNQTKNDAHLPLAVMTYILDKACLSYRVVMASQLSHDQPRGLGTVVKSSAWTGR